MASDQGLIQDGSKPDQALATVTGPTPSLMQRLAAALQRLRARRAEARARGRMAVDIKAVQRVAPHLMEDVGIYDRATAASIRRMEARAAAGRGLSRHDFITRL